MKTQIIKVSTLILVAVANVALANTGTRDSVLEIDTIAYLEEEEITPINFETEAYLPVGFNPYEAPTNFQHISYIDEGQLNIDLGFDTQAYLPAGFNPYPFFFDIDSIEYIDENDLFEIDFNTKKYLPRYFNSGVSK